MRQLLIATSTLISTLFLAGSAAAATLGFVEDFSAGTGGFGLSGGSTVTHVTSGGVGGGSDPYISISNAVLAQLGSHSIAPDLVGDLLAAGVTGYSFWLRDTGANDNHQIHVGVGIPFANVWLSIPGFTPPDGSWQQFSVDLTDPSQWVQILGTGTFQEALAGSDRLLFRHDLPPLVMMPNTAIGDFGLDLIQVLPVPEPGTLALLGLGLLGLVLLRRRGS